MMPELLMWLGTAIALIATCSALVAVHALLCGMYKERDYYFFLMLAFPVMFVDGVLLYSLGLYIA